VAGDVGRRARRGGVFAALLALVTICGCSTDGDVILQNRTQTQLTGSLGTRGFSLAGNENIQFTIKVGTRVLLFGPDEKDVELTGESCTRAPFTTTVTVKAGETQTVEIFPDAACAVYQNEGDFEVREARYRPTGDAAWSENILDEPLFFATVTRFRLPPNAYDFLMVDVCEESTLVVADSMWIPIFSHGDTTYVWGPDSMRAGDSRWIVHYNHGQGCP
jgi:hypothetical protein